MFFVVQVVLVLTQQASLIMLNYLLSVKLSFLPPHFSKVLFQNFELRYFYRVEHTWRFQNNFRLTISKFSRSTIFWILHLGTLES